MKSQAPAPMDTTDACGEALTVPGVLRSHRFQPLTVLLWAQLFILISPRIAFSSIKIPRDKEGRNCSSLPSFNFPFTMMKTDLKGRTLLCRDLSLKWSTKGGAIFKYYFLKIIENIYIKYLYILYYPSKQTFWGIVCKRCIDFPFKFQIHHISFSRNWDKLWKYSENKFSWPLHSYFAATPVASITQHKMLLRRC